VAAARDRLNQALSLSRALSDSGLGFRVKGFLAKALDTFQDVLSLLGSGRSHQPLGDRVFSQLYEPGTFSPLPHSSQAPCRGASLTRMHPPLRTYSGPVHVALRWSRGGGAAPYERGTPAQGYLAHKKQPPPRTLQ